MQKSEVTVGLVVHNEERNIEAALTSIYEATKSSGVEIIIVDNGSTDSTLERITIWKHLHPGLPIRTIERNVNHMARARNDVIHSAQGSWIYFIDADCRLLSESWNTHLKAMRMYAENESVAGFGGGNIPAGRNSVFLTGLKVMSKNWLSHMGSIQLKSPQISKEVLLLSTCNLFLKTDAAKLCSGFDDQLHPAGEDLSLCYRLKAQGLMLMAHPDCEVEHHHQQSWTSWARKMFRYGEAQIKVGQLYPDHLKGTRGIQLVLGIGALSVPVISPSLFAMLLFAHGALFVVLCLGKRITSPIDIACGYLLTLISQFFYLSGELYFLSQSLVLKLARPFQATPPALK